MYHIMSSKNSASLTLLHKNGINIQQGIPKYYKIQKRIDAQDLLGFLWQYQLIDMPQHARSSKTVAGNLRAEPD